MVTECADIAVIPDREAEFETAMTRGRALLAGAPGCTERPATEHFQQVLPVS
jgi:hypothetical protein